MKRTYIWKKNSTLCCHLFNNKIYFWFLSVHLLVIHLPFMYLRLPMFCLLFILSSAHNFTYNPTSMQVSINEHSIIDFMFLVFGLVFVLLFLLVGIYIWHNLWYGHVFQKKKKKWQQLNYFLTEWLTGCSFGSR